VCSLHALCSDNQPAKHNRVFAEFLQQEFMHLHLPSVQSIIDKILETPADACNHRYVTGIGQRLKSNYQCIVMLIQQCRIVAIEGKQHRQRQGLLDYSSSTRSSWAQVGDNASSIVVCQKKKKKKEALATLLLSGELERWKPCTFLAQLNAYLGSVTSGRGTIVP
jgi:hypothetical protein